MADGTDWTRVGNQVRQARLGVGMSQAELATRVGLPRAMIANVEAGVRRIDALELIRLATALDVPLDELLRRPAIFPDHAEEPTEDGDRDAARRSQQLDVTLTDWLSDVRQMVGAGTLRAATPMRYGGRVDSEADARLAARWLREAHGVGIGPIDVLSEFSQRSGQYILMTALAGDGASLVNGALAVAVISISGDPGRRRAAAAHELGHLVLGDQSSMDLAVHGPQEGREAVIDAFAAELLLPVAAFAPDAGDPTSVARPTLTSRPTGAPDPASTSRPTGSPSGVRREDVIWLAARYRTSWSLALRQAELAGRLDPGTRGEWSRATPPRAEFMDAVGWSPQPDFDAIRVPPGYSCAVMQAWRRGLVTSSRAVELLHGQIVRNDLPVRAE